MKPRHLAMSASDEGTFEATAGSERRAEREDAAEIAVHQIPGSVTGSNREESTCNDYIANASDHLGPGQNTNFKLSTAAMAIISAKQLSPAVLSA
ncbi:hypothetical protein ACVW16_005295 [Bradyrhizobium sp. USDA 4474]